MPTHDYFSTPTVTEESHEPTRDYFSTPAITEASHEPKVDYFSRGDRTTPTSMSAKSSARRISTPPTLPPIGTLRSLSSLLPNEVLGQTSAHFLRRYFEQPKDVDTVFGLKHNFETSQLEIGDKTVKIFENDVVVAGKQYPGRRQLWNLLLFKDLQDSTHSPDVLASYANILKDSNAIYQNNDPRTGKPKSSRSQKYTTVIRPIWEDLKSEKLGKGLIKTVKTSGVDYKYYTDANQLVDRLRLLYASTTAGADAHGNEILEIMTELENRGIVNNQQKAKILKNIHPVK